MEWALLLAFALLALALVALPHPWFDRTADEPDLEARRDEQRLLLAELRDLDEDAAAGRISDDDRREGRRALAPRLRAVHEALSEAGDEAGAEA